VNTRAASDFLIGSFATINAPQSPLHGSLGEVVRVEDPRRRRQGYIALHLITGPKSYVTFVVRPDMAEPANQACYHCLHARHTNDRDVAQCAMNRYQRVSTSHTCEHFTKHSNRSLNWGSSFNEN